MTRTGKLLADELLLRDTSGSTSIRVICVIGGPASDVTEPTHASAAFDPFLSARRFRPPGR
jgi:hypothetical protein